MGHIQATKFGAQQYYTSIWHLTLTYVLIHFKFIVKRFIHSFPVLQLLVFLPYFPIPNNMIKQCAGMGKVNQTVQLDKV